jgi:hypothetical protein
MLLDQLELSLEQMELKMQFMVVIQGQVGKEKLISSSQAI